MWEAHDGHEKGAYRFRSGGPVDVGRRAVGCRGALRLLVGPRTSRRSTPAPTTAAARGGVPRRATPRSRTSGRPYGAGSRTSSPPATRTGSRTSGRSWSASAAAPWSRSTWVGRNRRLSRRRLGDEECYVDPGRHRPGRGRLRSLEQTLGDSCRNAETHESVGGGGDPAPAATMSAGLEADGPNSTVGGWSRPRTSSAASSGAG